MEKEIMTNKKKTKKRYRFTGKVQHVINEIDYFNKLSDEEKKWLNEFNDGTLNNNCRKYDMFTDHPEYERIKKEIYNETNSRNRCTTTELDLRKRMLSLDVMSGDYEEYYISNLLFKEISKKEKEQLLINFGIKDIETSIKDLIKDSVGLIKDSSGDCEHIMLNFYVTMNALVKEEIKERKKQKKIEKEKLEKES